MTRDQLAALARGTVWTLAGGAILYAIGRYLGLWVVGAIVVLALADAVWLALRLPTIWRPW